MKGNWAAAPTQQPVLIIICWSVAWAMINDSVRPKTKHSASYLQSTCSCGPIGREWKRVQAAHGLIMGAGGWFGGGGAKEKGVERTEQRWRRRWSPRQGYGFNCRVQVVQKRAHFKNSQNCVQWNVAWHKEVRIFAQDVKPFLRPRSSAGIYPLHLELTKCQLAGSFPARCEHAARGRPPVIDLTDRVDFHGACVCYIQAPLSPCCTGVDIYETCRRGPLDRTNERTLPGGGLRSLTLPSSGRPWYCSSEVWAPLK